MLVLNRREGEAIVIGGDIRVVVLSSGPKGVRLGIEAPAATTILREELVREIASANREASAQDGAAAWVEILRPKSSGDAGES